ncbi:MAG: OmpA family protein, partial [Rubrivivax sp.]
TKRRAANLEAMRDEQRQAERARLQKLAEDLERRISESGLEALKSQIRLDMTRDGLRIQIVDAANRPMFASGSAIVQPYMRTLLRDIGSILVEVPNRLTLEGHTDATPFGGGALGYTNWELSADRANASRRELVAGGLPADRVLRVQGLAASSPFERNDPNAPVNRRISIIVMNRDAEDRMFRAEPEPGPGAGPTAAAPAEVSSGAAAGTAAPARPAGR